MSFISNFNKESFIPFFIARAELKKVKKIKSIKDQINQYKTKFQYTSVRKVELRNFTRNINLINALQLKSTSKNQVIIFSQKTTANWSVNNALLVSIEKELYNTHLNKQRQNYFILEEFLFSLRTANKAIMRLDNSLYNTKKILLTEELKNSLFINYKAVLYYSIKSRLFYNNIENYALYSYLNNYNLVIFNRIFDTLMRLTNEKTFPLLKNTNLLKLNINKYLQWQNHYLNITSPINFLQKNLKTIKLKQKKISSHIVKRIPNLYIFRRAFLSQNKKNNAIFLKNYLWKKGIEKSNLKVLGKPVLPLNNESRYNFSNKSAAFQISYLLSRVEDKISLYAAKNLNKEVDNLKKLKTLLLNVSNEKKSRVKKHSFILSKKGTITRIKRRRWSSILTSKIKKECLISKKIGYKNFIVNTLNKLYLIRKNPTLVSTKELSSNTNSPRQGFSFNNKENLKVSNNSLKNTTSFARSLYYFRVLGNQSLLNRIFEKQQTALRPKKILVKGRWVYLKGKKAIQPIKLRRFINTPKGKKNNIRRNWVENKIILNGRILPFKEKKLLLSSWLGTPVDIFFINALSFTKFAFKFERLSSPKNNPNSFLSVLDRDFINKYKYIGIYIKDLVRIALIAMLFKKPSFLAKFVAFQLAKLPKNRKETSFIRFLIKVIKTLGAERREILGVRIKFKGRVNRWRRTKFIIGTRGYLPLQSIKERIEQGTAQAINRKGAVGIRIWVRYRNSFRIQLRNHIFQYIKYSRLLNARNSKRKILISN